MPLAEDTILEKRYRIDGLLTRGGMGAIYRAFDLNLSMPVAIKENFFQTPERVAQFKQEALILARLRHPALPMVSHHFSAGGKQYLVMDFVEGENLWETVERARRPLSERRALNYIIQVCRAVDYLHSQNPPIIHRDIKPQNIKITPNGKAVLVDFGIAKQVSKDKLPTQVGAQGVTPGFSPPEQYSGEGTTPASDIYSLGATLYAVLTGKIPPLSVTLLAGGKLTPPNKINPDLSREVTAAIVHAMQAKPAARPPSVAAWQKQLEAIAALDLETAPDKDTTLASAGKPAGDSEETLSAPALPAADSGRTYWLVDATGLGYPLGGKPLVIGRYSGADIVIEDLSVSRSHAQIRVEGGRCLVLDNNSANGTFLNGRRLRAEWYPLNPGDLLAIGSVRFYLTTTRPARLASPKPKPAPAPVAQATTTAMPAPAGTAPKPAGRPKFFRLFLGLAVALAAGLLAIAVYGLANPNAFLRPVNRPATSAPVAGQTGQPLSTAEPDTPTPSLTPTPGPTATPTAAVLGAATALTPMASATPTASPTRGVNTPTPTPGLTATPTPAAPRITGPTVMPLLSDTSIPEIGFKEVIDVDINPRNPREVFALVKGDGIYKSINGGSGPWARVRLDGSGLVALVIDPSNPARLYAPTWNAVLKSEDGGNTWDPKTNGLVSNRTVDVVAIDPTRPNILYAGVGENLVVSTDGGETWSSQIYGAGLGVARFYDIVVDPFNPDVVYVAGLAGSIYKSTDAGRSFIQLPYNTGEGTYGMAAHPTRQDFYLAGINSAGAGIIKTENGFDFVSVSTGLVYGGADSAYSALAFAPGHPNIVYTGSGYESNPDAKGIFKSTDGGETWTRASNGLAINPDTGQPYYVKAIAVHPTNPDIVLAATGGGLYKSVDGGASWRLK